MLRRLTWKLLGALSAAAALLGGLGAGIEGTKLYLVASGSVQPGAPIYVGSMAPTTDKLVVTFCACLAAAIVGFVGKGIADARLRGGPNQPFKPTPTARPN